MRVRLAALFVLLFLPAGVWGQAQVINGSRVQAGWLNYGTTAGTGTAYTLTFSPALPSYVEGQCFLVKPHVTNTGAATLNVQGLGAKALVKRSAGMTAPLIAGDLPPNRLIQACYDGTDMQVTGNPPDASGASVTAGIVCDGVTQVAARLQAILDTVPVSTRVLLPPGQCLLNTTLTITRSLSLVGAGMDATVLRQTVPDVPVLTVNTVNVHVTGMTLMHAGTPTAGGDGLIVRGPSGAGLQAVTLMDVSASWNWRGFVLGCVTYSQAAHVWAMHNNSHGFEFLYDASPGCGTDQWDVIHAISQLNLGAGFYGRNTAFQPGIGPWLTQTMSFGNNQGGYVFVGETAHGIHDLRLHNTASSADNVHGIYLDTYGTGHLVSEPWIELVGTLGGLGQGTAGTPSTASNTGHCLEVTVNNTQSVTVTGGLYWNCAWSGLAFDGPYNSLTGGQSLGNGRSLDANLARRAGVHIGAPGVAVHGHTFGYLDTPTLHYLHLSGALTMVSIGLNTYAPGIAAVDIVHAASATFPGTVPPLMVAGLAINSNAPGAGGLQLFDASGGTNPRKFLRISNGELQVLNAAAGAVVQSLSDAGTPSWPQRRGQVQIADTNTTATVTLTPVEPDANYFVQLTAVAATGSPPVNASTIVAVTKAAGSFQLTVGAAPGSGKTVSYDWLVYR